MTMPGETELTVAPRRPHLQASPAARDGLADGTGSDKDDDGLGHAPVS